MPVNKPFPVPVLLLSATFDGQSLKGKSFYKIEDGVRHYDGKRLSSLRIDVELTSRNDFEQLMNLLLTHQWCFVTPVK